MSGSCAVTGTEPSGVDSERHEHDGSAVRPEPVAQLLGLALRVRDDRAAAVERISEEATHPLPVKLHEPLGQPDRHVDDRRPDQPRPLEQDEWNADRVDCREDDVRLVDRAQATPRMEAKSPP